MAATTLASMSDRSTKSDRSTNLRRAIQADALGCVVSGISLIATAGPVAAMIGLPTIDLLVVGGMLFPYAAWLWYVATRPTVSRRAGWIVTGLSTLWVIDSILVLAFGWLPLTNAGWWLVVAQTLVIAALAEWQFLAMYKSR